MVKEMLKEKAGYLLSNLLSQGGEYGEIFYEKVRTCRIQLEDNKIDKVQWGIDEGVGIAYWHTLSILSACAYAPTKV